MSPPSRRRGSKHRKLEQDADHRCRLHHGGVDRNWSIVSVTKKGNVASITEAWIETTVSEVSTSEAIVASITEAWIETRSNRAMLGSMSSPPSRRRGSKLQRGGNPAGSGRRLHHGGVDRNTATSVPVGMCRSRLHHGGVDRNRPPTVENVAEVVASITEAWIETPPGGSPIEPHGVASITEAWIETRAPEQQLPVDRVASITEAWIETDNPGIRFPPERSPPSRRRGSKQFPDFGGVKDHCRLHHGGVDRNSSFSGA